MKFLFSIIFSICSVKSFSQEYRLREESFIDCGDSTRISIQKDFLETIGNKYARNTIFFIISKEDTLTKKLFEGQESYNNLSEFNIIKIIFSVKRTSLNTSQLAMLSNCLYEQIFDIIKKNRPHIFEKNNLFYGFNDGAPVALSMALQNPGKINKTALYFTNYQPSVSIVNEISSNAAKLKAKLFIFTNNDEDKLTVIDEMITNLALKSTAMFYRIDTFGEVIDNANTLGYNWLLADGNNIILKTEY
jgi:hypothetical protein